MKDCMGKSGSCGGAEPVELWRGALPLSAEAEVLKNVDFHIIKPYEFAKDGYRFLHGVALAWHKSKLYASFGHNVHGENLAGEEAMGRYSIDGGNTWSGVFTIDSGCVKRPSGISHGVFLSHNDALWAFHGAFGKNLNDNCHTRAYILDEGTGGWTSKGTVVAGGFFPMQEPQKMDDGNWIMSGVCLGGENPAAVAVSYAEDFSRWDLVSIPKASGKMFGESSIIVKGNKIINIARYNYDSTVALVAASEDYGRTWTRSMPSNLKMAASKPYAGTLSSGRNYLISTTTADSGNCRRPLTIALTNPGEDIFSSVFVIRHADFACGPGESHPHAALSYPYAIEHGGRLYVGYSNNGGNAGREEAGLEPINNNSAELAVIPVKLLD